MKYKIIIVDDHDMFREGVKVLLGKSQKVEFIGEASNGEEFLRTLGNKQPDVVLMDISMPVMDGIEATRQAMHQNPNLKILALSMFGEEEYYYKMIQAGVHGFVMKSSGINELEHAIEEVARGASFFSPELLN
jgi:DNA-binding NarL/FixJ family response regulator